jgi:hypothetical protein
MSRDLNDDKVGAHAARHLVLFPGWLQKILWLMTKSVLVNCSSTQQRGYWLPLHIANCALNRCENYL